MEYTLIVLLTYAAVMLGITVCLTKKENNIEKFCVGNRNTGWMVSALSIAATWIWAPALFTSTENAYTKGFAGLFWFLIPNILCLILFIPFAKKIREEMPEGITLSGYMYERYHSKAVRNIYLFQLSALSTLSTGVQLLAGSKILSMLTGIPFAAITVIMAVIAFSYSQFSGIKASILTDAVQMVLMLGISIGFVVFSVKNGGGLETLVTGLGGATGDARSLFSNRGWEIFLGFGLPTMIGLISGPFGDQCFWQRAFCVKKDKIGSAFFVGALLFGIVPLSMGILGLVGAGIGYVAVDTGVINFELISTLFPAWVVIPFLFMIVSGLLSTIDVWLYLLKEKVDIPEIYLFLWQSGTRKGQLRVSQFFSIDTAKSLVKMNEYYPDLMERIVRREPNAYLAALYWDSEMFGRSTVLRKQNEKGKGEKDYKAALLELFSDMDGNFQTKHKRYVAERYRNFFISVSAIADNKDCKSIYEGLISGDPKLRSFRALYQRIYGKYVTKAKKKEGI